MKSEHVETSPFYLQSKNTKALIDLSDGTTGKGVNNLIYYLVLKGNKSISEPPISWLYLPFYWLGLTGVTSYDITYISSGQTINICGILEINTEKGEYSISNPAAVFFGAIQEVVDKIKHKIFTNLIWTGVYFSATVILGSIWFYRINRIMNRYAVDVEKAKMTQNCIICNNFKPTVLRRPCLHIGKFYSITSCLQCRIKFM